MHDRFFGHRMLNHPMKKACLRADFNHRWGRMHHSSSSGTCLNFKETVEKPEEQDTADHDKPPDVHYHKIGDIGAQNNAHDGAENFKNADRPDGLCFDFSIRPFINSHGAPPV